MPCWSFFYKPEKCRKNSMYCTIVDAKGLRATGHSNF